MKLKITVVVAFSIFSMGASYILGQHTEPEIVVDNFEPEIVNSYIHGGGKSGIKSRYLFVYLPESSFSRRKVYSTFDELQKVYCDPYILTIYMFSDREMLAKQLRFEKTDFHVDFTDSEEGRESADKYYQTVLPGRSGYFRAEYSRYGDYEYVSQSPTKEGTEMTTEMISSPERRREFLSSKPCVNQLRR